MLLFDVSNSVQTPSIQYIRIDSDITPERLTFIALQNSPDGKPALVRTHPVSSTTTPDKAPAPDTPETFTLQLLHASDQEGALLSMMPAGY